MLIERLNEQLREREEAARQAEVKRKEQERLEGIKKKELARINNERRRENERRRTQEIKFNREDFEQIRASQVIYIVHTNIFYFFFLLLLLKVNGKSEASQSVSPTNEEAFKRGESLRLEPQKHKRTPSFTTRLVLLFNN